MEKLRMDEDMQKPADQEVDEVGEIAEGEPCSICQDAMDDDHPSTMIICNHRFHTNCIIQWFRSGHSSCPLCRDVPADLADEEEDGFQQSRDEFVRSKLYKKRITAMLRRIRPKGLLPHPNYIFLRKLGNRFKKSCESSKQNSKTVRENKKQYGELKKQMDEKLKATQAEFNANEIVKKYRKATYAIQSASKRSDSIVSGVYTTMMNGRRPTLSDFAEIDAFLKSAAESFPANIDPYLVSVRQHNRPRFRRRRRMF